MQEKTNWEEALKPLLKLYKGRKHPLDYKNLYQLVVMVILSAQDSDKHINQVAPKFFEVYPDMEALSNADQETVFSLTAGVRNFANKTKWLMQIGKQILDDKKIPLTMNELIALPGIGRKSANVIMREAGKKAEGIIVDLHVVRVAPRIGIVTASDPVKIEKQLMQQLPEKSWGEVGMAISFLGREICRPTNPKCPECVLSTYCAFFQCGKKG